MRGGFPDEHRGRRFRSSKYGILPEILPEKRLSWGNGVLELGTFMAIICGTIAAGFLAQSFAGREIWSGIVLLGFAAWAWSQASGSRECPPPSRTNLPLESAGRSFHPKSTRSRKDRMLSWRSPEMCTSGFWASLLLINVVLYGTDVLHVETREPPICWRPRWESASEASPRAIFPAEKSNMD